MNESQVLALQSQVIWWIFGVTVLLGYSMARSNFCTMGAISDIVNMQDWTRMRMWLFAIAVAIAGTATLSYTGQIDLSKSIYVGASVSWLSALLGGLLFGFGMVLASGCGSKTLIRIGSGSLRSLTVFVVMGVFAYMSLRGLFGVIRTQWIDPVRLQLPGTQDLATLIGGLVSSPGTSGTGRLVVAIAVAAGLALFCLKSREFRQGWAFIGGLMPGLVVIAGWYISGHLGYVNEDPNTLQEAFLRTNSGRMESISFVAPAAYTLELFMLWSDKTRVVTFGIAATAGMIIGSLIYALTSKTFRLEGFAGTEDTANHLLGAAAMGIGGVLALGCTVGQGLSGISTLALGSLIALTGILLGGYCGMKYQSWRVEASLS
jgi:uncharacterized protein